MSDHKERALEALKQSEMDVSENWRVNTGELKADVIAVAQAHATLELAEQQRLANLIEIAKWNQDALRSGHARRVGDSPVDGQSEQEKLDALMEAIRKGVGL